MYAIHSAGDTDDGDMINGKHTGYFPTVDEQIYYTYLDHGDVKDETYEEVYLLVTDHYVSSNGGY